MAAAVSLLVRLTTTPPDGADALRVTVPATGWPPRMLDSASPTASNDADGWSVTFFVFETPLQVAVIVAVPPAGRLVPVTVKVAVAWPTAIRLLAGTVATFVLFDERVTVAPEGPAGPVRVRVPVATPPPGIVDGETARVVSTGFETVSDAVFATPPAVAVSVTVAFASTPSVVTAAVAVFTPARTVTVAGRVAAWVLELVKATAVPPAGAFPASVTVRVAPVPPFTLVGETLAALITGAFTVSVAVLVTVPRTAVMTALALAGWGVVVTENVFVFVPEATVTEVGTVAAPVLPLESVTTFPPAGAFALSVTVPVDAVPPVTLVGLSETDERF